MKLDLKKSKAINDRARAVMPGGVSSPVRSFRSVGGEPFVAASGKGPYILDVDSNEYIDLVGSWGPLIHGHCHPRIQEAVQRALENGSSFGITCESEVLLCEKIVEAVPSVEMLRLVSSGTEACMSAVRLARGATKRDLILKFEGHYHGHADHFLVSAGSGLATLGTSSSAGVSEAQIQSTISLPFNSSEALEETFSRLGDKIAGVILEVVSGNMGVILPDLRFLQTLRELCDRHDSLLIFDEVMTGFRLSLAGAQGLYPIRPDLSCFGKVIGAGFPVAAYGGRKDLMSQVAPLGPVYQAGTLSGNPVGTAAGLESLMMILENPNLFYQSLDQAGSEWRAHLEAHIQHRSYPVSVQQVGSMMSIFFRAEPPQNYEEAKASDLERFNRFFWNLMELGVYYPPSAFESSFLSAAHDASVMERVAEASVKALDRSFGA